MSRLRLPPLVALLASLASLLLALGCVRGEGRPAHARPGPAPSAAAGEGASPEEIEDWTAVAAARRAGEPLFVDSGVCPFECCTYGRWRTEGKVTLRAAPREDAPAVDTIPPGLVVRVPTGEVHVRPGRLVLSRALTAPRVARAGQEEIALARGDTIEVLSYLGEGAWRIRPTRPGAADSLATLELDGAGDGCGAACVGRLLLPSRWVWWVRVETADGIAGWSPDVRSFTGNDACGTGVLPDTGAIDSLRRSTRRR
jgi:hypothetical protein